MPWSVGTVPPQQFVRTVFLLCERTDNTSGKFSVKFCCHFMYMLYKVKGMPLFLLFIAVIILEVVTGYCFGFDFDVIYPFKIP